MDEIDFIFKLELDEFPHQGLTKIADLIYFEGPLLSLFIATLACRDYNGPKYLYYWCDASDVVNRWLLFSISDKRFDLYLRKKISLREVILEPDDGLLHVCDIDGELRYRNVYVVSPDCLPESYIPDEDSYYEFAPEFMLGER